MTGACGSGSNASRVPIAPSDWEASSTPVLAKSLRFKVKLLSGTDSLELYYSRRAWFAEAPAELL